MCFMWKFILFSSYSILKAIPIFITAVFNKTETAAPDFLPYTYFPS